MELYKMKIAIAHPNASYVEATRQVISVQNNDYEPIGATSLDEVLDQLSKSAFDILLIDSELANGHQESFTDTLKNVSTNRPTILTVSEDDEYLIETAKKIGVFDCVVKKKGYLAALSESLKRAVTINPDHHKPVVAVPAMAPVTPSVDEEPAHAPAVSELPAVQNGEIGYFVCDRKKRFLSVNHYIEKVTGYSNEELLELTIDDVLATVDDSDFFSKILSIAIKKPAMSFDVLVVNNIGEKKPSKLQISLIYDEGNSNHIIGFRGNLSLLNKATSQSTALARHQIDQKQMISQVIDIIHRSYSDSIDVLLKSLSELVCQVFGFNRSTVALLDPRKQAFVKQAMVGYSEKGPATSQNIEVPQKVIDKVFSDNSRIKVIYHNKEQRQLSSHLNNELVRNDSQETQPIEQWHKRDLIILNLADKNGHTFGYISLDDPIQGNPPTKATFYNLELFSRLVSVTVENYYRISNLERRNRRMKQILVNSNVFKLYYSLSELLKEVVWSVKFSLDFNLVSLVLISKKSGMLETKAVACDDKIKLSQIRELKFNLAEYSRLLHKDYQRGKSYLVSNPEPIFEHMKRIYYGPREDEEVYEGGWPSWDLIIVPIKSREEKIIGFLMADDPNDCRLPNKDTVHTLEILANQIAIAIDNRVMYVQAKEQIPEQAREIQNEREQQPRIVRPAPVEHLEPANDPTEVNDHIQDYQQINMADPEPVSDPEPEPGPEAAPESTEPDTEFTQSAGNAMDLDETSGPSMETEIPSNGTDQQPTEFTNPMSMESSADFFADADFTKTGFKKLVERFLR